MDTRDKMYCHNCEYRIFPRNMFFGPLGKEKKFLCEVCMKLEKFGLIEIKPYVN